EAPEVPRDVAEGPEGPEARERDQELEADEGEMHPVALARVERVREPSDEAHRSGREDQREGDREVLEESQPALVRPPAGTPARAARRGPGAAGAARRASRARAATRGSGGGSGRGRRRRCPRAGAARPRRGGPTRS